MESGDEYVDASLSLWYDVAAGAMAEHQLPQPQVVKREAKRLRLEPRGGEPPERPRTKVRHREDAVYAPRSLFDRPSPALVKIRR